MRCYPTALLGLTQPTISYYLKILVDTGSLTRHKRDIWAKRADAHGPGRAGHGIQHDPDVRHPPAAAPAGRQSAPSRERERRPGVGILHHDQAR